MDNVNRNKMAAAHMKMWWPPHSTADQGIELDLVAERDEGIGELLALGGRSLVTGKGGVTNGPSNHPHCAGEKLPSAALI